MKHVPVERHELLQADQRVDWETLALIYSNLASWMTEETLLAASASAWRHPDFGYWLSQSALHAEPREQLTTLLFDRTGILESLPLRARISRSGSEMLMVDIMTDSEVPAPQSLLHAIAGELAAIPAVLGTEGAEANVIPGEVTTRLEFWLPKASRLARIRRAIWLPLHAATLSRHARQLSRRLIDNEQALAAMEQERDHAERSVAATLHEREQAEAALVSAIDDKAQSDQELRDMRRSLQALTANIGEAIIRTDANGVINDFNEAALNIFGCRDQDMLGANMSSFIPDARDGEGDTRVLSIESKEREATLQLQLTVLPSFSKSTTWVIRDLTEMTLAEKERAALQHQLQASQRVESLGEFTGGIAHDFNNLLVAINGYAELALGRPELDKVVAEYLEEIRRAGSRASDMTQKLLTFARRQDIQLSEVDLNALIKEIEGMIRRLLPASIDVRFTPSLQSPCVIADPGQLEQVIVNLCVNARDAMPDGGRLSVTIGSRTSLDPDGALNEAALIIVEDNGAGMPQSTCERIFEPFFTTKGQGEGTGLGLSVVYGIIKRFDGMIEVDSQIGRGTRFEILLPVAGRQTVRSPADSAPVERPKAPRSQPLQMANILLVEDNDQVRRLCERVLIGSGYDVIAAADGEAGIAAFEANADQLDLVIVDLVMPKRSGREVFDVINQRRPDICILFSTGYDRDSAEARFIHRSVGDQKRIDIIEKPYTPDELCRRVEALLDEGQAAR